jgi:hypothetical protein
MWHVEWGPLWGLHEVAKFSVIRYNLNALYVKQ